MRLRNTPILLVALAACAPKPDGAPAAAPQVATFTATDFAFAGPDTIAPGFTTIRLDNQGQQAHHLIIGKFADGKTMQDFMAALKADPNAEPPFMSWHGAASAADPGSSAAGTVNLPAGNYVAICFMPDPMDGKDHLSKGMTREFVVAGTPDGAKAPAAESEIHLKDFGFVAPTFAAGTHTFRVINDGPQTHEIQLVRLNDGATAQQFLAAMAPNAKGPPPGLLMGGPGAYSTGLEGYWTVTFTPGKYMFVCFVPDPATGVPHFMKGMVQEFTVS